jgi:response regulator of citrate/malate metabolism
MLKDTIIKKELEFENKIYNIFKIDGWRKKYWHKFTAQEIAGNIGSNRMTVTKYLYALFRQGKVDFETKGMEIRYYRK